MKRQSTQRPPGCPYDRVMAYASPAMRKRIGAVSPLS